MKKSSRKYSVRLVVTVVVVIAVALLTILVSTINTMRNNEKYNSVQVDSQEIILVKSYAGGCAEGGETCKSYVLYGDGRFGDKTVDRQVVKRIAYEIEHLRWKEYPQDRDACRAQVDGVDEVYRFGDSNEKYSPCGISIPRNDGLNNALKSLPY